MRVSEVLLVEKGPILVEKGPQLVEKGPILVEKGPQLPVISFVFTGNKSVLSVLVCSWIGKPLRFLNILKHFCPFLNILKHS